MNLKHVKTLVLDNGTRLFFTIENNSEAPFYGNMLLELRNWWGAAIANFDMPTKVIEPNNFGSFYIDVPPATAKRFSRFAWIWHKSEGSNLIAHFKGKGRKR